ncbi:glycosyltransferase family 2 protein [Atlantibacter subterraneus]|uniref:glycosyltransferase family 2 protein n=1 Tax=Atlantibacter subterraneus TaxID=255519 RepID=UPI0028B093EB|nr:glycosyltransferase family 2 protein [Atlantibacter subterranea]
MNKSAELTISLVVYQPTLEQLYETLNSLVRSLQHAQVSYHLYIIDNTPVLEKSGVDQTFMSKLFSLGEYTYIRNKFNIGFGRAHNLTLGVNSKFHLVLNPDLIIDEEAISKAIEFMNKNENCGLISPYAIWSNGKIQRLCKNYPSVFILLLRGFAPHSIKKIFKSKLEEYEMVNEITNNAIYYNPPMVSGCFMFFKTNIWKKCRGFDENYFLYFEDFDLSIRIKKYCNIAYVPEIKIIHHGGFAARKGFKHIILFFKSMIIFFTKHHWRWF